MKISRKLSGGFTVLVLFIILVTLTAGIGFDQVNSKVEEVETDSLPLLLGATSQSRAALEAHSTQKDFLYASTAEKREQYREATLALTGQIAALVENERQLLSRQAPNPTNTAHLEETALILTSIEEYNSDVDTLASELNESDFLKDKLDGDLKSLTSIINMFIDDKAYANADTSTLLDALKEIDIAQLKTRLLVTCNLRAPLQHMQTPKEIAPLSDKILEELDRYANLVQNKEQIQEYEAFKKLLEDYPLLVIAFFKNEVADLPEPEKEAKRQELRAGLNRQATEIDRVLAELRGKWEELISVNTAILESLESLKEGIQRLDSALNVYLKTESAKALEKIDKVIMSNLKQAERLKNKCKTDLETATTDTIIKGLNSYSDELHKWFKLRDRINTETSSRLCDITTRITDLLQEKLTAVEADIHQAITAVEVASSTSLLILYSATGLAVLLAIILSVLLICNITRPIRQMSRSLEDLSRAQNLLVSFLENHLATGDWSSYCDVEISAQERETLNKLSERKDEIGQMSREGNIMSISFSGCIEATNQVITQVNHVLNEVASTVVELTKNASQLEAASQELADGATRQAANLEEVTSALHDLSSRVETNAAGATQAMNLSSEANTAGVKGTERMNNLVQKMEEINSATGEITNIVKTIDTIAFQTNLLALNAAVEAARAGSHGKGFAVVAEEVRSLAARSSKAAGETSSRIENIVNEIGSGNSMVGNTSAVLAEIVGYSRQVTTLSSEVAAASTEQSAGITQINKSLVEVDEITQHNAASAEETASSSQTLNYYAKKLQELTERFQLQPRSSEDFELDDLDSDNEAAELEYTANPLSLPAPDDFGASGF